jgi:hypothetical protein
MATHLLKQGVKSEMEDGATCAYRGENQLMCAVGALIKGECYNPALEGDGVESPMVAEALMRSGEFDGDDVESCNFDNPMPKTRRVRLFEDMQGLHDMTNVEYWRSQLIALADEYELSTAAIDAIPVA